MNIAALLLRFLGGLVGSAASRLLRADRGFPATRPEVEMPTAPPPIGHSGAADYLSGRNDEAYLQAERERLKASADELARKAAAQDEGEPELPSEEVDGQ